MKTPQPPKNTTHTTRAELVRRYGVLLFMSFVTIIMTVVSLLLILGYQLNPTDQTLTQGGLVKFDTFPTGATITLDNMTLSPKTPHQQTKPAKNYQVNFSLKGYRPWNSRFAVEPGKLAWINYARLVPEKVVSSDIKTFPSVAQNLPSPNRQFMVLLPASDQPLITLVDLSDVKNIKTTDLTIPADILTHVEGKPHAFSLHEWSRGSDYFTLKHTYGDGEVEFLRFQRSQLGNIINITGLLGSPFTDINFYGTSHDEFYALSEGNLRKISLAGDGTMSAPMVTKVLDFNSFKDDGVIYVTDRGENKTIETIVNNTKISLATVPKSTAIQIGLGNYYDDFYATIAIDTTLQVYHLNLDDKKAAFYATIKLARPVAWMNLASTSRHILVGSDTEYLIYDIDTKSAYNQTGKGTRGAYATQPFGWLDESYIVFDADDKLVIRDYTGYNSEEIAAAPTGYASLLSRDEKSIFYIGAGEGASRVLRQAHMVNK